MAFGNYGSNRDKSGKYFALTTSGARNLALKLYPNTAMTLTSTSIPQSLFVQGNLFQDTGGAGPSLHFREDQLPMLYQQMTRPRILGPIRAE